MAEAYLPRPPMMPYLLIGAGLIYIAFVAGAVLAVSLGGML